MFDVLIVGGFGHVGLPLGIVLADGGLNVGLYDIDTSKRATIEAGTMPFLEHGAETLLKRVIGKSLHVVDSLAAISEASIVIITIGTPVDEYLNPKTTPILKLAEKLKPHLRPQQCLILRSTVFPGTGRWLNDFFRRDGFDVHITYCPERIVQGHAIQELRKLPQIISGFSTAGVAIARSLFEKLNVTTIEVTVEEAEFAKLFANAWRYLQFAIANQFYMMATAQGANYERIYHAVTANYDRGKDFPRPGFTAGPCLLKDTLQLAAFGSSFQLGHAAMVVNEGLPAFIVQHIQRTLRPDLNGVPVGILGMAFKADIDDIRDSLSYKLAKILRFHGAEVLCSDEYVKDPAFVLRDELIQRAAVVVVGVPHSAYRGITFPKSTLLIDLWGIASRAASTDAS